MNPNYTAAFLYTAVIVAAFYFLWYRPQQRQRKAQNEMLSALKIGDKVMTAGGLYGTIRGFGEDTIHIEVASGVIVDFAKGAIVRVDTPEDTTVDE
jgi:preprotein translocase subunit YajC